MKNQLAIATLALIATTAQLLACNPAAPDCSVDPLRAECFVSSQSTPGSGSGKADAVLEAEWLWPGGDVYVIEDHLGAVMRAIVRQVQRSFEAETPIRLHIVASASEAPQAHVFHLSGRWVGDGGQSNNLGVAATNVEAAPESVAHEIGHVLGFFHAMQRVDRDEHIVVHWPYINDFYKSVALGVVGAGTPHIGPYDMESIMEYSSAPLGHLWCSALSRRTASNQDPARCIGPFAMLTDAVRAEDVYIALNTWYSALDYARISTLYCDSRYCGDRCASAERCNVPTVQAHLEQIAAWERSAEGQAWRAKYPAAAR